MTENISLETCDLGLGNGLKPGAMYANNSVTCNINDYTDINSQSKSKITNDDAVQYIKGHGYVRLQDGVPLTPDVRLQDGVPLTPDVRLQDGVPLTPDVRLQDGVPLTPDVPIFPVGKDSLYLYQLYFGSRSTRNQSTAGGDDKTLPTTRTCRFLNSCDTDSILFHLSDECLSGLSIQQQRTLFHNDLEALAIERTFDNTMRDKLRGENVHSTEESRQVTVRSKAEKESEKLKEDIEPKLLKAQEELTILSNDLEVCHSKLTAKCKAIEILRTQAGETETQHSFKSQQNTHYRQQLEKEVNSLQFSLEYQQSSFMDSQQTWSQRYDRLCQDNAALQKSLDEKNEELMLALREKNAACLERDELFALLDVIDRQQYDRATPTFSGHNCEAGCDINHCTYSVTQLAVLGACLCRGKGMEPCRCAHVAARLKAEVLHLKEQMDVCMANQRDLECTIDAYRMAFDEQLSQNRVLLHRLAELCVLGSAVTSPKLNRAKAALRNLLQVDGKTDDLSHVVPNKPSTDITSKQPSSTMSAYFDDSFIDMLSDRLELLAQQKVAARILALKNQQLTQDEVSRVRGCTEEAFQMLQSDDLT